MGFLDKVKERVKKNEDIKEFEQVKSSMTTTLKKICPECKKKVKRLMLKLPLTFNKEKKINEFQLCEKCK